jgi:hypothetical protein
MRWQANCSASGSASPTDAAANRVLIDQLHAGASTWAGPVANLQSERSAEDHDGPVQRIWHAHGLKPHLTKTFKISRDKDFAPKVEDVVGLYLNPPDRAGLSTAR